MNRKRERHSQTQDARERERPGEGRTSLGERRVQRSCAHSERTWFPGTRANGLGCEISCCSSRSSSAALSSTLSVAAAAASVTAAAAATASGSAGSGTSSWPNSPAAAATAPATTTAAAAAMPMPVKHIVRTGLSRSRSTAELRAAEAAAPPHPPKDPRSAWRGIRPAQSPASAGRRIT